MRGLIPEIERICPFVFFIEAKSSFISAVGIDVLANDYSMLASQCLRNTFFAVSTS